MLISVLLLFFLVSIEALDIAWGRRANYFGVTDATHG